MRLFILVMLFVLSGCKTEGDIYRENLLKSGMPITYVEAEKHGCHSAAKHYGHNRYEFKKDLPRYRTEPDYKDGWDDGYTRCTAKATAYNRLIQGR